MYFAEMKREDLLPELAAQIMEEQRKRVAQTEALRVKAEKEMAEQRQQDQDYNALRASRPVEYLKIAAQMLSDAGKDVHLTITDPSHKDAQGKFLPMDVKLVMSLQTEEGAYRGNPEEGYREITYSWDEANAALLKDPHGDIVGFKFNDSTNQDGKRAHWGTSASYKASAYPRRRSTIAQLRKAVVGSVTSPVRFFNASSYPHAGEHTGRINIPFKEQPKSR